ncbi:MAG TPA: hypothetical protein VMV70_02475 [Gallionella sp.]|nr:hypothetical protein [Gallionella sp.]
MNTDLPHMSKVSVDFVAFLIPCLIFIEIKLVGRLFLPELILLVMFIFLIKRHGWVLLVDRPAKTLIMLGLLWLFSQILTDVVRSTSFHDLARGWANIGFFLISFCSIYMLVLNSERRLMLFALGIIAGQILKYLIAPNVYVAEGYFWKFGIGYALTFLIVLSTQFCFINRVAFLPEVILVVMTFLNWTLGFRSLGAICFMVAIYLLVIRFIKSSAFMINRTDLHKRVFLILLLVGGAATAVKLYSIAANSGIFGEQARQLYSSQSAATVPDVAATAPEVNFFKRWFGVLIGGRQELLVSTLAIWDSPLIGHGSWAKDIGGHYHDLLSKMLLKYGYNRVSPVAYDPVHIPTHSFLFGAWVYAGLAGAVFWCWVFVFCSKVLLLMYKTKNSLTPVVAFIGFNMLWNIPFSPFGAETRLYTAYYLVLLMFMHRHLLIKQADQLSAGIGTSIRVQETKQPFG